MFHRLHRTVCFARLLRTSRKTGRTYTAARNKRKGLRKGATAGKGTASVQRSSDPAAAAWRWQGALRLGRKGPTSEGEGSRLRRPARRSSPGPCEEETRPHHHTRATFIFHSKFVIFIQNSRFPRCRYVDDCKIVHFSSKYDKTLSFFMNN